MKKKILVLGIALAITFQTGTVCLAQTAGSYCVSTEIETAFESEEETEIPSVQPGWIKKEGKYYWRLENGKIYKKKGLNVLGRKTYYLNADGSRVSERWRQVDGKFYYFQKDGVKYDKKGWFSADGYKYYLGKGGYRRTGFITINKKRYYFNPYGKLFVNKKAVKIDNKYYTMDQNGVVTSLSEAQVKCSEETRKFIEKHTKPGMTNSQKFRACYNYLLGYMHYRPRAFNANDFVGKDWPYNRALSVYQSNLTGNCYGFACCVAACAKELGYEPYVIVTTGDHGFVMIDGKYYDNMGALFGASSHFAYRTLYKVKF